MIVYGAGLSDGNRHLHEDLPTLIAGRRRQLLQDRPPRRRTARKRRCATCFLTLMDRMGVHVEHFGDSTGEVNLAELT